MSLEELQSIMTAAVAFDRRNYVPEKPVTQHGRLMHDRVLLMWFEQLKDMTFRDAQAALLTVYRKPMIVPLQAGHLIEAHENAQANQAENRRPYRDRAHELRQNFSTPDGLTLDDNRKFWVVAINAIESALEAGSSDAEAAAAGEAAGNLAVGYQPSIDTGEPIDRKTIQATIERLKKRWAHNPPEHPQ